MKTTEAFIHALIEQGIKVTVEKGKLRVRAARGTLTETWQQQLKDRKEELIAFLDKSTATYEAARSIKVAPREERLPLSFAQQRLWFIDRMDPGTPVNNVPFVAPLPESLDKLILERTLNQVVSRHEVLRTCFPDEEGRPYQKILPYQPFALPFNDLSSLAEAEREREIVRLRDIESHWQFELATGPLFRFTLLKHGTGHLLLVNMHHIATDAWSMEILTRELMTIYASLVNGKPASLPALPIQYADYAAWQRQWLSGEILERKLAWWRQQLGDNPPVLHLPTDRPYPPVRSSSGATYGFNLPGTFSADIQALTREQNCTAVTFFISALNILLGKYCRVDDMCIGMSVAGRNRVETENLIGFFVNILVLRCDQSGDPTFLGFLDRVNRTVARAYDHEDVPFEKLVEELAPSRDLSHTPLFQVAVTALDSDEEISDRQESSSEIENQEYDLSLTLVSSPSGFQVTFHYLRDLFDAASIRTIAHHFEALLGAILAAPQNKLTHLALISKTEREQVLHTWNQTDGALPSPVSLQALFERCAASAPAKVAVIEEETCLTYEDLNRQANALARQLCERGAGRGQVVALYMERGIEAVSAILGILKTGAAYLPLDMNHPQQRLTFICANARVGLLVTDWQTAGNPFQIVPADVELVVADEPTASDNANPPVLTGAEDLAYIMYTSGSTGEPKGVAIPQVGVVRLLFAVDYLNLGPTTTTLQAAPLAFDASTLEIWGALLHGGTCLIHSESIPTAAGLETAIQKGQVQVMWLTAALFNMIVEEKPRALAGVSQLLVGGEALSPTHVAAFLEAVPEVQLSNGYGPTESTTFATNFAIDIGATSGSIPIGRPIGNTTVYILDPHMHPLPPNLAGELFIGGLGLARGYINRPGLTAASFVPNPHAGNGSRLYRSGDLARFSPDGSVSFMGRIDAQVKIRGFRIEPGEIENVLAHFPAVLETAVLVREDIPGSRSLAAYVTLDPLQAGESEAISEPCPPNATLLAELRSFLVEQLPEYMLPSSFTVLVTMPITANGKVDRRALATQAAYRPQMSGGTFIAPATATEEKLAGLWHDLLAHDPIGSEDNFFELGGHSLMATQLVAQIQRSFGLSLPLATVFEEPVLRQLAACIDAAAEERQAPPIEPVPRDQDLPLSFAQQRLWFIDRLTPGSPIYNVPFRYVLPGQVDLTVLERVIGEILRRHEVLRTCFPMVGEEPVQSIQPFVPITLPVVDLSGCGEEEKRHRVARHTEEEARFEFDLANGPLYRFLVLRLDQHSQVLLINLHHIVTDGWSMDILGKEVEALYAAFALDKPSPLPDLALQYADFSCWQRSWFSDEILREQLSWWCSQLEDQQVLELPTDRPRRSLSTPNSGQVQLRLSATLSDQLRQLAQERDCTLFVLMLAAYKILLGRWGRSQDISVGTVISGRGRAEIADLIGFFVNTLVLRSKLPAGMSFTDYLGQVRGMVLDAFAHQDLPFERLVEAMPGSRDGHHPPLFQVTFTFVVEADEPTEAKEEIWHIDGELAKFELTLSVIDRPAAISINLAYMNDLFLPKTIENFARQFRSLLEGIVARPVSRLGDLPTMSDQKRVALLKAAGATSFEPTRETLVDLFGRHVRERGNHVALEASGESLTYAELDRRAGELATRLVALGIGPDRPVAIAMTRCLHQIIAIWGVLKAGAAYLPIDPEFPQERIRFLLADTAATVLLTTSDKVAIFEPYPVQIMAVDTPGRTQVDGSLPSSTAPRKRRLHYLHFRFHRPPQGRGCLSRQYGGAAFGVGRGSCRNP